MFGGFGVPGALNGNWETAVSPFIGAQAGASDLAIGPGAAAYPAAKATGTVVTMTLLIHK